jgi:hypothetical protein
MAWSQIHIMTRTARRTSWHGQRVRRTSAVKGCCKAGVVGLAWANFFCGVISLAPAAAFAQWTATPYAAEAIEHNSNVYDLPTSSPAPQGKNGPTFSDTSLESRAGIDGTYLISREKFFGTAEFRRFDYQNFTLLDHNEYLLDGGLNWKLVHTFDGLLEYRHEQRMVPFQNLEASTQLILETDNTATASANVNVTPEWRVESLAKDHTLDSPRTDIPDLSLHEDSIREGLRYLGVSNLSAGVDATYLQGTYRNDPTALTPDYHQVSLAGAATYIVSGFTNFSGNLGYTRRTDPTNFGLSAVTGSVNYLHTVTGKTSINVQLNRTVNTYVTTAGNELDTSAFVSGVWQATYKTTVKAGYGYTTSKYPQAPEAPNVPTLVQRLDHIQSANAEVDYQMLHWLMIRAYGRYQTRHSNQEVFDFDGTVVGIELVAKQPKVIKDLCDRC